VHCTTATGVSTQLQLKINNNNNNNKIYRELLPKNGVRGSAIG
jgi:hypothetical protein